MRRTGLIHTAVLDGLSIRLAFWASFGLEDAFSRDLDYLES